MSVLKFVSMATLTLGTVGALAAPVVSYGNIGGPGVYFGSGNVDGNWTISTDNNIQVALRAKNRSTLQTIDGSDGTYNTGQGLVGGNKAVWNYEFSVNLRADGTGTTDFSSVIVQMWVDTNPGAGTSWSILDVENNWADNYWWDGSAPRRSGLSPVAGEYGVQQSVNPMFSDSGMNFNPGPGDYSLRLVVTDDTGRLLSEVSTTVQVPEPASVALVGVALAGLGWASRRQRRQN